MQKLLTWDGEWGPAFPVLSARYWCPLSIEGDEYFEMYLQNIEKEIAKTFGI